MLRKGHHGVRLDAEAWDRLITWIDLHTPCHGTWHEIAGPERVLHQRDQRRAMLSRYAGIDEDPESVHAATYVVKTVAPATAEQEQDKDIALDAWPFDATEAHRRQSAGGPIRQTVPLDQGIELALVRVPPGSFVMGDRDGPADERPLRGVNIDKGFWLSQFEITNEQYRAFDSAHDSRLEHGDFLQFSEEERGYTLDRPAQPVVRVSADEATAFCRWLSAKTGRKFRLPTEQEWEYACRAGTATPLNYGSRDDDFSAHANLADLALRNSATYDPWKLPSGAIAPWRPADVRFNDRARVSAPVGSYRANAWGLHDMHGNAAEWTSSRDPSDAGGDRMVVRGGSWNDRPHDSRSAFRLSYHPWQRVCDVGVRVVCEAE
jgi:formylglycine-generating enzyme required for sulfatase activity